MNPAHRVQVVTGDQSRRIGEMKSIERGRTVRVVFGANEVDLKRNSPFSQLDSAAERDEPLIDEHDEG